MRAHYLQHVSFEGLGTIEAWLLDQGFEITGTRFFESTILPDPNDIDVLIIMGGPMSVNEEEKYPWLVEEKKFIREMIDTGKPILGICLGAQLIASALGSKVYPNSEKEIGWFPVTSVLPETSSCFTFPYSLSVFHWHGETFDLPKEATLLAGSNACKNQAFQIGPSVIGLQFHLEMTPDVVQALVANCRDELVPSTFVQSEQEILSANANRYKITREVMNRLLSYLLKNKSSERINMGT
ncbi:type 1 glutamine amidotransferase [Rhodohalobacter sp. 614A]|uniref:type 1 glutamine amidotransferase n=1 Tax=Rhodohalobacter sp. 614A TaxID=2908649 RepID=UPI001F226BB1|nr:type 1 glutamine amidotransferase [Rhodohalobacter sp. 614A]